MADLKLHAPGATTFPGITFQTKLEGTFWRFRMRWMPRGKFWVMDLSTAAGTVLFKGHRMTEGADMLAIYTLAEFPRGQLFVVDSEGLFREPTRHAFRNTHDLRYRSEADTAAAVGTDSEVF